ncbi:diaminobutyrate acetyltransferase [Gordonia sp. CPCC 205333]|uniref:diaminobutyrate acetyltransferase n=1 Tax=Gordonia sp. CPCC 205333 TaxID=3140790 RepID=UPI003AF37C25
MRPFPKSATPDSESTVVYRQPRVADGSRIHQIAEDSKVLDTNTPYAYVLWCHDFAETSVVAEIDGRTIGFVTGYLRPTQPSTVMVWQVAVDAEARGRRVAAGLLHSLLDAVAPRGVDTLTTTISPDNEASQRLFASVAKARGMSFTRDDLFSASDFTIGDAPADHQPEDLYTLAP